MMTAPAITIWPNAPLRTAARLMNAHHIRRLPVVDESGKLLEVVSRRDLLSALLRPDDEIAADGRTVITNVLLEDPSAVDISGQRWCRHAAWVAGPTRPCTRCGRAGPRFRWCGSRN